MSVTTTTRLLIAIGMILGTFQICLGQQWMRRKRASPVLAIDDLNPLSSLLEQDDYRIMDRNLGIGGYHRPSHTSKSEKSSKSDKSSKEYKSSKESKSSKSYKRDNSFDFFSLEMSMSIPPRPTTPVPPVPSPTSPSTPTTPAPVQDPTSAPAPTNAPGPDPTTAPDSGCSSRPRAEAMVDTLSAVTDAAVLTNPSTPQGMAYRWLLDADPAQIDPCTYPTVEQRYALTTMYYSTNGDDWAETSGWLTGANECMWFGVSCGSDQVTDIALGTFACWIVSVEMTWCGCVRLFLTYLSFFSFSVQWAVWSSHSRNQGL